MKIFALFAFLACLGYASAQCGCLKAPQYTVAEYPRYRPEPCSKHLTIIGQSVSTGNCPPATIISRESPSTYVGRTLPVRIQAPAPAAPTVVARDDLRYRIVETAPCQTVREVVQPSAGVRYNTKVEVPVPVPTSVTSTTINLRPCVDRVIIPSSPRVVDVERCQPKLCGREPRVYVNPKRECPIYIDPIRERPVYVNPFRECTVYGNPIRETPVYVNSIRETPVCVNPIKETPVYASPIRERPVYVNSGRETPVYTNPTREVYVDSIRESPVCSIRKYVDEVQPVREPLVYGNRGPLECVNPNPRNPPVPNPCPRPAPCSPGGPIIRNPISPGGPIIRNPISPGGPIIRNPILKKLFPRYENLLNQFSLVKQVDNLTNEKSNNLTVRNRSKRDVPFLKHGYKFMVNMLPDFIQEPIKKTVNDFALVHPDERLQRMYNQPRKPTLKEKLQMQKKNIALLKSKLRDRIAGNLIKKPYTEARTSSSLYDMPKLSENRWPKQYPARTNFENLEFSQLLNNEETPSDFLGNTNAIAMKPWKKALLMRKLQKLDENQSRAKRSTIYEKHWSKKFKKPPSLRRRSNLLDTSNIVLPFYQVKEDTSRVGQSYNYLDSSPWEVHFDRSPYVSGKHRYRRDEDNFLEPYTFKDVAKENHDTREHLLRSVIKEELGKYRVQNEAEPPQTYLESSFPENKLHHSPILHVITFPLRLISKFSELTNHAFPIVGSLPKVITGTKKYFKDFGKNFRKNMLHLTSDLIGDFENLDLTNNVFGLVRSRRSPEVNNVVEDVENDLEVKDPIETQCQPNYFLVFDGPNRDPYESKVREKRYILKKVDEDEIEEYLMEKLSGIFSNLDGPTTTESYEKVNDPYYDTKFDREEESQKRLVLEHLKPKIILDNNGKPFLEINGYKRPLFRPTSLLRKTPLLQKTNRDRSRRLRMSRPFAGHSRYYDSSEEADSEKIASLIHHAKNHLESSTLGATFSEMPAKTIKEKISQLLFETDILVHMDFEKYDDIYDDLIALQQMKSSIVEDWKRLIMSKTIDDIGAKTLLLERFKELQYYKDVTLTNVVTSLYEDNDNIFIAKKLIKMLIRLQKLQCLINQVVSNFHGHLHISNKSDIEKEIKYADFLNDLNFALAKSRNAMISNLMKDRDEALQKNIFLLDKLKKLLMYETTGGKVEKEANLLWEMKNIEKMQKTTIEEMKQRLDVGYRIKNELKILFDLLRRYETCEADQRRLLSKYQGENSEEQEEEKSEPVQSKHKKIVVKKKIDLEELRLKWQERLRKRNALLRKTLKRNMNRNNRKNRKKSKDSDEDD